MSNLLSVPKPERPSLTRSRSSSSPIASRDDGRHQSTTKSSRPTHTRSHSYMSPVDLKANGNVNSPVAEKPTETSRFSRLHLPGRHHSQQPTNNEEPKPVPRPHHGRHRYTQSEAHQYHKKRSSAHIKNDSPGNPLIIASSASSSEHPMDLLYPSSRGAAIPSLMRMTSTRSYRGDLAGDLKYQGLGIDSRPSARQRAISDPRTPALEGSQNQVRSAYKSPIELQLERADFLRRAAFENITEDEIKRKDEQLKTAKRELHGRLANTTRAASDLMRRLDDAQDTLFRTTESLVDTISSFSNLSDQSSKLISNFDHESHHLDQEIRNRIARYRNSICNARSRRAGELESRGQAMSKKAEELGQRLENCRTIVKNWEEREVNKRRAWRGVWVGIAWGVALIAVAVVAGFASWKASVISHGGGTVKHQLQHLILGNASHDAGVLKDLEVPEDVREILVDIDSRVREGYKGQKSVVEEVTDSKMEDQRIRLLDEL